MDDNHLQPKVEYQIQDVSDQERRVVFQIQPGARSDKVVLAFEGASGIDPDELDKIVEQQRLERQLFTDPLVVTELLERYYREQGYLSAEIDEPRYEYQGPLARVVLPVREGPEVQREERCGFRQHRVCDRCPRVAAAGDRRSAVRAGRRRERAGEDPRPVLEQGLQRRPIGLRARGRQGHGRGGCRRSRSARDVRA